MCAASAFSRLLCFGAHREPNELVGGSVYGPWEFAVSEFCARGHSFYLRRSAIALMHFLTVMLSSFAISERSLYVGLL